MSRLLTILERVLAPDEEMDPAVAAGMSLLQFSDADQSRYLALAERHNNGELSEEELGELRAFVEANSILTILKLKAKRALSKPQSAA